MYNEQIIWLSETGGIGRRYSGEQEGFYPSDIVSHSDKVYITDLENNRVDELTADGEHVRLVISAEQGMKKPYKLCVDNKDGLFVAQADDRLV